MKGEHMPTKRRKFSVYWTGLGIYTVILLILSWRFLSYTDKALIQYENSQPEAAMESYMAVFKNMIADGTLCEIIDMPEIPNVFEPEDAYDDLYEARLAKISSYTFDRDAEGYSAKEPVYCIYGDGVPVAKVTLSALNEHTIFGILTIMDWEVKTVTPVLDTELKSYTLQIPDTYKATVNGIVLNDDSLTGTIIENPEFANVSLYVKMPYQVEYEVLELINEPEIKVFDADGKEAAFTFDEDGNVYASGSEITQIPEERYNDALKMAQAWDNFLTGDLGGDKNGLSVIQQYLVRDSYYWNIAGDYARSVDITYISEHTLSGQPYSNIEISDYISYGENCYSCHIYFEKNMILESGARRVNTIDSTFYFVNYDDSDDGVDNPHWAIADMIASTGSND